MTLFAQELENRPAGSVITKLILSLLLAVIIWFISLIGGFKFLDGYFYDSFIRLVISHSNIPSRVVVIPIPQDKDALKEDEFLKLLKIINKYNPSQVVINFIPHDFSENFYYQAGKYKNIVFGHHTYYKKDELEKEYLQSLPAFFSTYNIATGIVKLPKFEYGIYRWNYTGYAIGGMEYSSLEMVAARRIQDAKIGKFLEKKYLIYFRSGLGSLSVLSLERVLVDDLLPQLVKGKAVLIGNGRSNISPGLVTPVSASDKPMSLLEFQGHSLNTLINGMFISFPGQAIKLAFFLFISMLIFLFFQKLNMRTASWTTLLLIVVLLAAKYASFKFIQLWLPVEELIFLLIILLFFDIRYKNIISSIAFQDLLLNLNAKLRERYYPDSVYRSKEYWNQVVTMVTQTLSLNRLIFLERVSKDHRVREVQSFNCELMDIDEKRRDYLRYPYSEAIKEKGMIKISTKRPYLKRLKENEEQFLVPLTFAGDVLGFWAFGITVENKKNISGFENIIGNFSSIIGGLLYNRQELQREKNKMGKILMFITSVKEQEAYSALKQTIEFLKWQFDNLTNVFNELMTKAIVYDLFGRVLEVNNNMLQLLKSQGLKPYDMSLTDLLSQISGKSLSEARLILRKVVIEEKAISLLVNFSNKDYILILKPLKVLEANEPLDGPTPFGIRGIICELMETTSLVQIHEIKEKLVGELSDLVSKELNVVLKSILYSNPENGNKESISLWVDDIKEKLKKAIFIIDECKNYISTGLNGLDYSQTFPIDSHNSLVKAIEKVDEIAKAKDIEFKFLFKNAISYVLAVPELLRHVFEHILLFLINDALENTIILVSMNQNERRVVFQFKNEGIGISNEKFQLDLQKGVNELDQDIRSLIESIAWVKAWKGKLTAESLTGKGTEITLELTKFN